MKMCGEKIELVSVYKYPDRWETKKETILAGERLELWRTCGQRPGHTGEHGGYGSRIRRWRFEVECWWRDR
jgi:hypothetical protein